MGLRDNVGRPGLGHNLAPGQNVRAFRSPSGEGGPCPPFPPGQTGRTPLPRPGRRPRETSAVAAPPHPDEERRRRRSSPSRRITSGTASRCLRPGAASPFTSPLHPDPLLLGSVSSALSSSPTVHLILLLLGLPRVCAAHAILICKNFFLCVAIIPSWRSITDKFVALYFK